MGTFPWSGPSNRGSGGISSQSIGNGAGYVGTEIDNETNLDTYANVLMTVTPGTSPTADTQLRLYFLYDPSSAQYEDGDTSNEAKKVPVGVFYCRANTNAQRINFDGIPIPPFAFKAQVWNACGQTCTVTLDIETYKVASA